MPAEDQNVEMPAGDSRRLVIRVKDAAGVDIPLAGATSVRWWLGLSKWSVGAEVLIKKSLAEASLSILGSDITVPIAPGDTDLLPPSAYYHEAEVIFADGTVATVTRGVFTITPTIIRPAP